MNFFSRLLDGDYKTKKTCLSIYKKSKQKRPNKSEKDYLKIVLLTKPPFDYQHNNVINFILDEQVKNIEELSDYIVKYRKDKKLWQNRERNLRFLDGIRDRNAEFFSKFWE